MAAVQTLHTMTLGQQNKMYNIIQQHSPQQSNCVIVSTGLSQANKSVIQSKRPLAPAPERTSVLVNNNNDLRCKRKIQFMPYGGPAPQPASVARRNARERNRVKQVNNGFATLRQHIPPSIASALSPQGSSSSSSSGRGASKKLSKVETLRLAVEYIRSLQSLIEESESDIISSGGNITNSDNTLTDNRFYSSSPDSLTHHDSLGHGDVLNQQYSYPILLQTPTCSEASASPTPSHSSDGSFSTASSYTNALYHQQENFENYEPKSPEDEELLDAIFSWQQQN